MERHFITNECISLRAKIAVKLDHAHTLSINRSAFVSTNQQANNYLQIQFLAETKKNSKILTVRPQIELVELSDLDIRTFIIAVLQES